MVVQTQHHISSKSCFKNSWKSVAVAAGASVALVAPSAEAITLDFSFRNLSPTGERVLVRPPVAITPEANYDLINRGGEVNASLLEMATTGRTAAVNRSLMNDPDIVMVTPRQQPSVTSPPRVLRPNRVVNRRVVIPDDQVPNMSAVFAAPVVTVNGDGEVTGTNQFLAPTPVNLEVDELGNFMNMERIFTTADIFNGSDDGTGALVTTRPFPDGNEPLLELRVTAVDDSQAVPGPTPVLGLAAIAGTAGLLKVRRKRASAQ